MRAREISEAIAEWLVTDMLPLTTIEGKGFKKMIRVLESRYTIPSRNHIVEKHILPKYHETREKVKEEMSLSNRHAVTTDGWQSNATESFVTYTCHFITPDLVLKSRLLDTLHTPGSHSGLRLSEELNKVVTSWGLKDPAVVTDNAKNVVNAVGLSKLPHVGCAAHTLNLVVNKALAVPEVAELVTKGRHIVSYFKMSALKTDMLFKEEEKLHLQVLCYDIT